MRNIAANAEVCHSVLATADFKSLKLVVADLLDSYTSLQLEYLNLVGQESLKHTALETRRRRSVFSKA